MKNVILNPVRRVHQEWSTLFLLRSRHYSTRDLALSGVLIVLLGVVGVFLFNFTVIAVVLLLKYCA